ncbi:MAG TPA: CHAD domain-containing protein [Planctomycetaceae bacterium]|nr:CHAD domain-containing protein [Planctomycetaceae bacterium]
MTYRIRPGEIVEAAVRRIGVEQIDAALGELVDPRLDRHDTVHQVRKRCKKLRGLLRLVRPELGKTYAAENAWYRDAARALSSTRDAVSIIEALDQLVRSRSELKHEHCETVRAALVARRQRLADEQTDLDERLAQFAARLRDGRGRIEQWAIASTGYAAVAGGLAQTYRRGRKAMKAACADRTPENFHEWRKRSKDGWYHHRLLRDVWRPEMNVRRTQFAELGELLGDDHDLVLLKQTLAADPPQFGGEEHVEPLFDAIDDRRRQLEKRACTLGRRLYAETPRAFRKRIGRYWRASKLAK